MTAKSTQGSKISFALQSGFGTAATTGFKDIRLEGEPTVKTPVGEGITPQEVFADQNSSAKPIVIKKAQDDAVSFSALIRQEAAAGDDNGTLPIMFAAAGCDVESNDDTTINSYTDFVTFTTDDAIEPGSFANIELDDGSWCPTLFIGNGIVASNPAMALPTETSSGKAVNKMYTITPGQVGEIAGNKLVTVKATVKANDGASDTVIISQDCAVTSIGDLNLEPGALVQVDITLGASDMSKDTTSLGTNDFADAESHVPFNCPLVQFADTSSTGKITAAYAKLLKATFSFNVTAEQIASAGDLNCVNNLQGWMQKYEPCMLSLEMLYDATKLDEFTTNSNAEKYIGIIQRGYAETDPAFALVLPRAVQSEAPEASYWGNNEHRVTVKYKGLPAAYSGSSHTSDSQLNQPWYFGISDRS